MDRDRAALAEDGRRRVAHARDREGPAAREPVDPAKRWKCPPDHLTMAVVPAPCDHPDLTVGALSTGASAAICRFVAPTTDRMAA
jgi:hypothetical protein